MWKTEAVPWVGTTRDKKPLRNGRATLFKSSRWCFNCWECGKDVRCVAGIAVIDQRLINRGHFLHGHLIRCVNHVPRILIWPANAWVETTSSNVSTTPVHVQVVNRSLKYWDTRSNFIRSLSPPRTNYWTENVWSFQESLGKFFKQFPFLHRQLLSKTKETKEQPRRKSDGA